MENKKTKLTISGSPKKSIKNFETSKAQGKKTVVIEKQPSRTFNKGNFNKPTGSKTSFSSFKKNPTTKISTSTNDFERRKLAEQRATKRLKGTSDSKEKKNKTRAKKKRTKTYSF